MASYKLTEVARAAGLHPKVLRNWLAYERVQENVLPDHRERHDKGKWRRFTFLDALRVSIVSELWTFGIPAPDAFTIVEEFMGHILTRPEVYEDSEELCPRLQGRCLYVFNDGEWRWTAEDPLRITCLCVNCEAKAEELRVFFGEDRE